MKLSDYYPEMKGATPVEQSPVMQNLQPQLPNEQTQVSGNLRTTLPLPLQYSGDTVKQYNRPGTSSFRIAPLPPSGAPTINSTAAGVTRVIQQTTGGTGILLETDGVKNAVQSELNIIGGTGITAVSDTNGGVTLSSSGGDGLIHGDPIWWLDPAFTFFRDDFLLPSIIAGTGNFQSEQPWFVNGNASYAFESWAAPYMGAISWPTTSAAGTFGLMMPQNMGSPLANTPSNYWPMFEYPGWKAVFIFGFNVGSALTEANNPAPPFSALQTSLYIGLGSQPANNGYTTSPRLPFFCGLRYDTDPGNAASESFPLSSVGNVSAGLTVYTFTTSHPTANSDNFAGIEFIITGFSNPANNGTFLCVNSTSTTITLVNPTGAAQTFTGTATLTPISDTTFHFECVVNNLGTISTARSNIQGNTFNTGMTPTLGSTYRLEIECTAVGSVQFTLVNGSTTATTTLIMPQWSWTAASGYQYRSDGQQAYIKAIYDSQGVSHPLAIGSKAFISGSGQVTIDGARVVVAEGPKQFNFLTSGTITQTSVPSGGISAYPAVAPFVAFGNDNVASPVANRSQFFLDFVSFVRNPGVGGGTATPNPILPRYF